MAEPAARDGPRGSRERLTPEQRRRAARRLREGRGRDRHLAARLCEGLEVSAHWLRVLRLRLERGEEARPRGRPRLPVEERVRVRALVAEQFSIQGEVGWRDVLAGIRTKEAHRPKLTSTMLVQQETAALKKERRRKIRTALEQSRRGHEVLARDAIWAEDATHVGRLGSGEAVDAEIATDRATTATVIAAVGRPVAGEDIRDHLERAKVERGGLPLVWQSDAGSANTSATVADYLERERVIHLLSRVHTPTDNPAAENKNREIKHESELGKGVRLESLAQGAARLEPARRRIDGGRLRASRGWKTAAALDRDLPRADAIVTRATFYAQARSAMAEAVRGLTDPKAVRRAEQDAIWRTLEKHGLARTRVGTRPTPCPRLAPAAPRLAG